jgi:hypothetical protein
MAPPHRRLERHVLHPSHAAVIAEGGLRARGPRGQEGLVPHGHGVEQARIRPQSGHPIQPAERGPGAREWGGERGDLDRRHGTQRRRQRSRLASADAPAGGRAIEREGDEVGRTNSHETAPGEVHHGRAGCAIGPAHQGEVSPRCVAPRHAHPPVLHGEGPQDRHGRPPGDHRAIRASRPSTIAMVSMRSSASGTGSASSVASSASSASHSRTGRPWNEFASASAASRIIDARSPIAAAERVSVIPDERASIVSSIVPMPIRSPVPRNTRSPHGHDLAAEGAERLDKGGAGDAVEPRGLLRPAGGRLEPGPWQCREHGAVEPRIARTVGQADRSARLGQHRARGGGKARLRARSGSAARREREVVVTPSPWGEWLSSCL